VAGFGVVPAARGAGCQRTPPPRLAVIAGAPWLRECICAQGS